MKKCKFGVDISRRAQALVSQQPKALWVALGFVSVLLIGVVDYVTGSEISLLILFLLPLLVVTWFAGRKVGVQIAVASAATWLAVELLWGMYYSHPAIPYLNGMMLLGIYLIVVFLEQKVKERTSAMTQKIAERKQAEETLQTSERFFRALIENALDVITILDAERVIRYQSSSVERVLGYKPAELIGVNIVELLHPDDAPKVNAAIKAAAPPNRTLGIAQVMEARLRHKDGSWRILESIGKALPSGLPVTGIVLNSRDITERKRAEDALRKKDEHHRNVVESIFRFVPEGLLVFTENSSLVKQNKAFEEITQQYAARLGYTEQELAELITDQVRSRLLSGDAARTEIHIPEKRG